MEHSEIIINQHYAGFNPCLFGHEKCEPSHSYGPAMRPYWLLHYVVSGCGRFTREGITYEITAGQIFVIPPYVEIYYESDQKRPWKYIWIGFTTKDIPEVFQKPVISCPSAEAVFQEMLSCNAQENGRSAFLSSCIWKLVSLLLEETQHKPDYIDKAINYMHSDYASGITVQKLADSLGLNRSYFYTLFTTQMGVSPSEYLIHLRLKKAAEFMTIYHKSPTTAAMSVGYNDIYHFSKLFKKYYGMSPREYKRQNLATPNSISQPALQ